MRGGLLARKLEAALNQRLNTQAVKEHVPAMTLAALPRAAFALDVIFAQLLQSLAVPFLYILPEMEDVGVKVSIEGQEGAEGTTEAGVDEGELERPKSNRLLDDLVLAVCHLRFPFAHKN